MDLEIEKIWVSSFERRVKVYMNFSQQVEFVPFGDIFITYTSEGILKKDVRFIGDVINKLDYLRNHQKESKPSEEEIKEVGEYLKRFLKTKVKSILN